jgi:hypothetical protein
MIEQDIPRYGVYMSRLRKFAKSVKMKIKIKVSTDEGGAYIPSMRLIVLDSDNSKADMLAALLHELGHFIDHTIIKTRYTSELERAYKKVYTSKSTLRQKQLVLDCEKAAWQVGKNLAKQLDIPLGKWFYKVKRYCIHEYRKMKDEE